MWKGRNFARECPSKNAAPAQPNATKMNQGAAMKRKNYMKGHLNHVTAEEA